MYEYNYEEAGSSYYQYRTLPGAGIGTPYPPLMKVLRANSITQNWSEMRTEWCYVKYLGRCASNCVCGVGIHHRYLITNILTEKSLVIGSHCVVHIWNDWVVKLMHAMHEYAHSFRSLRSDVGHANTNTRLPIPRILLDFALKAGWLTPGETEDLKDKEQQRSLPGFTPQEVERLNPNHPRYIRVELPEIFTWSDRRLYAEALLYANCVGDFGKIPILQAIKPVNATPVNPKPLVTPPPYYPETTFQRHYNRWEVPIPTADELFKSTRITPWELNFLADCETRNTFSQKQMDVLLRIKDKLAKPGVDLRAFASTTHVYPEDLPNPNAITRANLGDLPNLNLNTNPNAITRANLGDLPNPNAIPGCITRANLPPDESNPWVSQ